MSTAGDSMLACRPLTSRSSLILWQGQQGIAHGDHGVITMCYVETELRGVGGSVFTLHALDVTFSRQEVASETSLMDFVSHSLE